MSVRKKTEFTIRCPHRPGEMTRILDALGNSGVNVEAFCGFSSGEQGTLMVVADDDKKAATTLVAAGVTFEEKVVLAYIGDSRSGEGAKVGRRLSDAGVNIDYAYASTSGAGESMFVFAMPDVDKAIELLN